MSGTVDPNDWRTWPRKGDHTDAPADSPMEQRFAAMWALACGLRDRSRESAADAEGCFFGRGIFGISDEVSR
jgi:hypothetical protein